MTVLKQFPDNTSGSQPQLYILMINLLPKLITLCTHVTFYCAVYGDETGHDGHDINLRLAVKVSHRSICLANTCFIYVYKTCVRYCLTLVDHYD